MGAGTWGKRVQCRSSIGICTDEREGLGEPMRGCYFYAAERGLTS